MKCSAQTKAPSHLSELTGQHIPIVMRISLLIKTNHLDQSNPKYYAQKEMVFQQNLLEKAYFIVKMSGPAMVWLLESALKLKVCCQWHMIIGWYYDIYTKI